MEGCEGPPPPAGTGLLDLDDACLYHIIRYLSPLPDVFNLAKTCWVSPYPAAARQQQTPAGGFSFSSSSSEAP